MAGRESRIEKRKRIEDKQPTKNWSKHFSIRERSSIQTKKPEIKDLSQDDTQDNPSPEQNKENLNQNQSWEKKNGDGKTIFENNASLEPQRPANDNTEYRGFNHSERSESFGETERYSFIHLGVNDDGLQRTLEAIPAGRNSLDIIRLHQTDVRRNTESRGSFYNATRSRTYEANTIYLAHEVPTEQSTLTFIHEVNHVRFYQENRRANVLTTTKNEYIDQMIDEETEGTVASILAKKEMRDAGLDVSEVSFALEPQIEELIC